MKMNYFQHLLMISLWVGVIMLAVLENGCNGCLEKERIALLQLKHSINFLDYPWLPSWEEDDSMDCCHWERVECNSTTRRVIKLELNNTRGYTSEDWHLNVSILLPFESLRSLDLSENGLRGFVQNEGIGILAELINLEELDLSWNWIGNGILPSLNKLSNLKILNLARNNLNGSISAEAELENGCNGCLEKDFINFPNGTSLPSWEEDDNMDCCHWECVECYSTTRRVIKLKLNRTRGYWGAEWHLNASILLPFESLQSLDLSQNQLRSFVGNEGMKMNYFQHLLMSSLWVVVIVLAELENGCHGCLEKKKRTALLQLKDSINFPNGTSLPSWEEDDNMDCCHWECVECYSTTRRVIKLKLNRTRGYWGAEWHLNASILLPFESLQSLDLSQNQLRSFVGNEGIGTLSNLHYLEELDLSGNRLDNSILPSLNKLSNLKILNLAYNKMDAMGVWKKKELLSWNSKIPAISQTALRCHLERKMITWTVAIGNVFSVIPLHVELSNLNSIVQEDIGAQSGI
ncbi:hypothetical protein RHMOL_Rhmol01G0045900 [Rhododendron molle]|uniref:Uncharacterized protein n=1 Tax=Rhododendron molle TaxID=49168 RepID=A0ACC0Q1C3_RHOML|nr:hypothetical protein RHMOL_Rhmol01G0045900 [Rhododendron molle]